MTVGATIALAGVIVLFAVADWAGLAIDTFVAYAFPPLAKLGTVALTVNYLWLAVRALRSPEGRLVLRRRRTLSRWLAPPVSVVVAAYAWGGLPSRAERYLVDNLEELTEVARVAVPDQSSSVRACLGVLPPRLVERVPIRRLTCDRAMDPQGDGGLVTAWTKGADPAQACAAGTPMVTFEFSGRLGRASGLVYTDGCTPTSWFDSDSMSGAEYRALGGLWFVVSDPSW